MNSRHHGMRLAIAATVASVAAALLYGMVASHAADAVAATSAAPPAVGTDANLLSVDKTVDPNFVKTAKPEKKLISEDIPVTGKLALDAREVRISAARVAGRLGRIFVFEGQSVHQGDALAEIYSPDFIAAENEYLLARRFNQTLSKGDADAELRSDSDATFRSAENKLKVLGATPGDIAELARKNTADEYLKIRAPISGVVTRRNVDPGAYLNVGDALMSLANMDRLWLFVNIYEADYAAVKLGQTLQFEAAALPGREFSGVIEFIAPSLDPATHVLVIRCDVPNKDFQLKPEMSVTGRLQVGAQQATLVPKPAIVLIKDVNYLFVQADPRHYRRVAVTGHPLDETQFAVTGGLEDGSLVVVDGGVLLNQMLGVN